MSVLIMVNNPCNVAPPLVASQLRSVEPSYDETGTAIRPCRLVLRDGRVVERALCVEERRGFKTRNWIAPEEIVNATESPYRLPACFANKLYQARESGMGYHLFVVSLRSGADFVYITEGIVDFPDYPGGVVGADVTDVIPHAGRERWRTEGYRGPAPYEFCYFLFSGAT